MSKGNHNPVHRFPKGNKLGGNKAISKEVKVVRNITKEEHITIVCDLLRLSPDDLISIIRSKKDTNHKTIIAALIYKLITKGDVSIYRELFDRIIGKVPMPIIGDSEKPPIRIIIEDAIIGKQ